MATDFTLRELNDNDTSSQFGYNLIENVANLSALGLVDDIAFSKNVASASHMIELAHQCLQQIGLNLNSLKSKAIIINNGKLQHHDMVTLSGLHINLIDENEKLSIWESSIKMRLY